ncbi:MAG TPA: response regulator, partial [Oceanospirillales bacterium]|nr:response regulator [Oceanospirillales bacterium]
CAFPEARSEGATGCRGIDWRDVDEAEPPLRGLGRGRTVSRRQQPVGDVHVLYIEDSRVVAHATKKVLSSHGLTADHVLTITDAIELLGSPENATSKYDVILSDYYLKDNETAQYLIEYVREIQQINKIDLPLVVMTGDENEKNQRQILRSGANDLVLKPVDNDVLIKKVQFQIRFKQFQTKEDKQ